MTRGRNYYLRHPPTPSAQVLLWNWVQGERMGNKREDALTDVGTFAQAVLLLTFKFASLHGQVQF